MKTGILTAILFAAQLPVLAQTTASRANLQPAADSDWHGISPSWICSALAQTIVFVPRKHPSQLHNCSQIVAEEGAQFFCSWSDIFFFVVKADMGSPFNPENLLGFLRIHKRIDCHP